MVVKLVKKCDYEKKQSAKLEIRHLTDTDRKALVVPVKYMEGHFVRLAAADPVLWVEHRPEADALVPEHHPILAAEFPTSHHNNIISSNAGAEKIDEYAIAYVTPAMVDKCGDSQVHLWCATALDNMEEYPTKADDRNKEPNLRAARTLGQKVVNGVVGRTEFSLSLMSYANLGHDAHEASDRHVYSYNVGTAVEYEREHVSSQTGQRFKSTSTGNTTSVTKRLKKLMGDAGGAGEGGGARRYTIKSQAPNGKPVETFLF